jgi:hypothetical protein
LKASFITAPLLIHANPSKPFVLEMNTFDFAVGVMFSQLGKENLFHPVDFCFRKFSPMELITRFMIKNF